MSHFLRPLFSFYALYCKRNGGKLMKLLEKMTNHLTEIGFSKEDIENVFSASVHVAQGIAMYAHRNQRRVNGELYVVHPYSVMQKYRKLVGIVEDNHYCLNVRLLTEECNIPYEGVQECCLLHDVLEDTSVTLDEMEELFNGLSLGSYFRVHIKPALLLLTHDKREDYFTYVRKVLDDPVASLVKLMDMADNMDVSTLDRLGDNEVARIQRYAACAKMINDQWHFLENAQKYFALLYAKRAEQNA